MRAVASGRLRTSLVYVDNRPRIADAAAADREWDANTDLSRAPDDVKVRAALRPTTPDGGLEPQRGAIQGAPLSPPHARDRHSRTGLDSTGHPASVPTSSDEGILAEASDAQSLATASAREKHFRAKLAELKYRERAGELVEAAVVTAQLVDAITICRTKLLGLPSKAKQRLPHLTLEDLAAIDAIVREALEELVPPPAAEENGAAA